MKSTLELKNVINELSLKQQMDAKNVITVVDKV
jgi:hypothetical protein